MDQLLRDVDCTDNMEQLSVSQSAYNNKITISRVEISRA